MPSRVSLGRLARFHCRCSQLAAKPTRPDLLAGSAIATSVEPPATWWFHLRLLRRRRRRTRGKPPVTISDTSRPKRCVIHRLLPQSTSSKQRFLEELRPNRRQRSHHCAHAQKDKGRRDSRDLKAFGDDVLFDHLLKYMRECAAPAEEDYFSATASSEA